jgi:hypothetical protein
MFSMAKFRCCRFHALFVFLLMMCAISLTAHYFMDAAGVESCIGSQVQQSSESCTTNPNVVQGADLHGGFMLNSIDDFSFKPELWFRVENTKPFAIAWKPPALVRPPIFS